MSSKLFEKFVSSRHIIWKRVFDYSRTPVLWKAVWENLAIADFLMCLYLFVIAGHDVAFRGEYIRHDVSWRHSWQCTFAGMLSTLSSEASIFIMVIITVDRYVD
ncbi:relaxin receptor 1 [Nephila pilipes]|uniref:Relaxin receptor 1 n=1 Tax=Nephila pilipes TaxID=299642 RepID=A0A8X6MEY7_NEPPI|nr:relaxin receptor 1 [Nephila pilipes]